ncbi:hypothetical protein ZWY2020_007673 [Hordeum vulgare]|nr:hypothetical protein ZWY2020_007673 [Hordeum vulgare]
MRSTRRRSHDNLPPPTSPTLLLPCTPGSKHDAQAVTPCSHALHAAVTFCSLAGLVPPLPSSTLDRPPGFEATPELHPAPDRTSEAIVGLDTTPMCLSALVQTPDTIAALGPLFKPMQLALLHSPESSPPKAPTRRHKTLAGVHISTTGGRHSLRHNSTRVTAHGSGVAAAMAKEAQGLLCRTIGIVENGQDITQWALDKFEKQFEEQVPEAVFAALRRLFNIEDAEAIAVEEALINNGGDAALDHDASTASPSV